MTLLLTTTLMVLFTAQDAPQMPKPGPEHKLLTMDAGTWDAAIELHGAPGQTPTKAKGVEVNTVGCGGLCLITDFKSDAMMGAPFHGHGITTWDVAKKKYVGSWTDSMSGGVHIAESTYDAAAKTISGWMEGPDPSGNVMKVRTVTEMPDARTRVFTLYGPGEGGKEQEMMRITYTRRK